MDCSLCVYLPVLNAGTNVPGIGEGLAALHVAIDGGSTDNTIVQLIEKGWQVGSEARPRSRIENWRACLTHFLESDYTWMRWLFAGDELVPSSGHLLERALAEYPNAKLIVGGFMNRWKEGQGELYQPVDGMRFLQPQEVLRRSAVEGNWFGPPLTLFLHRDLVANGDYDFSDFEWAGDFHAAMSAAAVQGCVVLPDLMGVFNGHQRQFFQARKNSGQARLETLAVRLAAIRKLEKGGEFTGSIEDLYRVIEKDGWTLAFQQRITNEKDPDWIDELLARFPARLFSGLLLRRLRRFWLANRG
jgi:hypothetical protein